MIHIITLLYLLTTLSMVATAEVIHVPGDYPTIQSGIAAASDHDTVLVGPGTYFEQIDFLGKAITVISAQGAETTVIDGSQSGSVVSFINGEEETSVLDGFTIRNGSGTDTTTYGLLGGGIYIKNCSPRISDNWIVENMAQRGGGIACSGQKSNASIEQCTISKNEAHNVPSGGYGGGIYLFHSYAKVQRCIISENTSAFVGGGISVCDGGNPWISGNIIQGNSTEYDGGGISSTASPRPVIENNIITWNTGRDGGGIRCFIATIRNNVIVHNSARKEFGTSKQGYGGGINAMCVPETTIEDNYIACNKAYSQGGGIFCEPYGGTIARNIICYNEVGGGSDLWPYVISGGGIYIMGDYITHPAVNVVNCLIHDNGGERAGGGIFMQRLSAAFMTNCTLFRNHAPGGSEIFLEYEAELYAVNSIFYGETGNAVHHDATKPEIYFSNVKGWMGGTGNIDRNPLFADPATDDFHLRYTSPCRDAGNGFIPGVPETDFEGDPREAYADVDMGADEFYPHLYHIGEITPGGWVKVKLAGLPGTSPVGLFLGSGVLEPAQSTMWGHCHLQPPWFVVPLDPIPPEGILVLPAYIPLSPPAPYDLPMQALIGLEPDSLTNMDVLKIR
jgi:hypothetical protein